ncbi:SwmB domain-containing protein [Verminephrobacter aporrectodeae]|nr:SwmB domain-containing protein [Verminephrobacter aporrectodeae]
MSYTKPTDGNNVVQDAAGNDAVSFSNQAVTYRATATDNTPPVIHTAVVTGDKLVLTYTEEGSLDAVNTAAASAFAVSSAGNAAISVNSVAVSGKTVTLTLSRVVTSAETVTLSYTKPTGDNVVQDTAGNDAVSFSNQAVTHGTTAADNTPPEFHSAAVRGSELVISYIEANTLLSIGPMPSSSFRVSSTTGTAITVLAARGAPKFQDRGADAEPRRGRNGDRDRQLHQARIRWGAGRCRQLCGELQRKSRDPRHHGSRHHAPGVPQRHGHWRPTGAHVHGSQHPGRSSARGQRRLYGEHRRWRSGHSPEQRRVNATARP